MVHSAGISKEMSSKASKERDLMKEQKQMLDQMHPYDQQVVGEEKKFWQGNQRLWKLKKCKSGKLNYVFFTTSHLTICVRVKNNLFMEYPEHL